MQIHIPQKALVYDKPGTILAKLVDIPEPKPEHQAGGNEGVGEFVQLGPGTDNSTVKVGDRVGIKWIACVCGTCGKSSQA